MGKHSILLTKPVAFAQSTLITEVLYTPASTTIKFSVLLLYHRLFPTKPLKIVSWCITAFLVTFALAQMLSVIIQCIPVAALWDPRSYPNAVCDHYAPALVLFAALNAATDIVVLCLPLPILWHLHASKTRRRQLVGVFLLGGLWVPKSKNPYFQLEPDRQRKPVFVSLVSAGLATFIRLL